MSILQIANILMSLKKKNKFFQDFIKFILYKSDEKLKKKVNIYKYSIKYKCKRK